MIINYLQSSAVDKYAPDSFNIYTYEAWKNGKDNPNVIPKNSDLNDYFIPGTYVSQSGSITNSLSNKPPTGSNQFKLFVIQTTGSTTSTIEDKWLVQLAISSVGFIAIRGYGGNWAEWRRLNDDYSTKSFNKAGYISFYNGLIFQWNARETEAPGPGNTKTITPLISMTNTIIFHVFDNKYYDFKNTPFSGFDGLTCDWTVYASTDSAMSTGLFKWLAIGWN